MAELSAQISSAIQIALDPSPSIAQSQRHEAYLFLQQVKDAQAETWQACLALFLEDGAQAGTRRWDAQSRMFGAQVVGDSLAIMSPEMLAFVYQSLATYFAQEFVAGNAESGVIFLTNSAVHLASLVFGHVYPGTASDFLSRFLSLTRTYPPTIATPPSSGSSLLPLNPQSTDLLLRLLHEVSSEISDAQLRLNKSPAQMAKDGELRDAIRLHDAPQIATAIWEIITEALDGLNKPEVDVKVGLKGKTARDVAEMAIRVVADYVSWIDINLMVTPTSIPLLLRALHLPSASDLGIRIATADALIETVSKGMPASDKLALLNVLDIGNVLGSLADIGRENGSTAESSEEVERFREKLAKLLNACGTELCKLVEDSSTAPDLQATALANATALLPLMLRFLADAHDDTSTAVFGFANTILSYYKKEKKRAAPTQQTAMTAEKQQFLTELLKVTLTKMQYKTEVEWEMPIEGEEEEDALLFAELRKNLRVIGDAIAWIDPELYSTGVQSIIFPTLDTFQAGGAGLSWQQLELSLYLVFTYGQALSATGLGAFVVVPQTEIQRSKQETGYKIPYNQFPLSPLGNIMLKTCQAKVVSHDHPAVALQFFELIVRYSDFFKLAPEFISEILPGFLDEHGLHQEDEAVRARVFYLFSRFVLSAKSVVQSQVSAEVIANILSRIQDLLNVTAELSDAEPANEDALTKAAKGTSPFSAQLYLFEAVGTLISILNQVPDQQVTLLRAVLSPLLSGLQANVRSTATTHEDYTAVLRSHHLIMAAGNVAKGFPDLSSRTPIASGSWVVVFRELTEGVLAVAKTMGSFLVIRDAARFAFNRIVATTGQAILPLIPALIDCLLVQSTFPELAELLSFLGLLVAKYKMEFLEMLDTLLWPVFSRVFEFLELPIAGTDDTVEHSALRRAYFSFILSIISANLQQVFYSAKNQPQLETILKSVCHYISHDALATDQRFGFIVLHKLLQLWVDPIAPTNPPTPASPVPGFEQFFYATVVKLCFEVTLKPDFDLTDAQSVQVVGEISNVLKGLLAKRGDEFVELLKSQLFPSLQAPQEMADAFVKGLNETPDGKQFKKFLGDWLKACRA